MTKERIETCLVLAERYWDASWDTSNDLAFMALRSAVAELITAIRLSTQTANKGGGE